MDSVVKDRPTKGNVRSGATWFHVVMLAGIGLACMVCAKPANAAPGPIDFKSREAKEGRSFTPRLIASLAVGKASGQANYEFDFSLPEGRGVTPRLGLAYTSSAGLSEIGHGWALVLPRIERGYQYGPPRYDGSDDYRYTNGHSSVQLVPTGETTVDGWTVFREESERSFARYLFSGNRWRVLLRNGIRYELGSTSAARRGLGAREETHETACWQIDRQVDTHGNEAIYSYEDGLGQQSLLTSIRYSGNPAANLSPQYLVQLVWEPFLPAFSAGIYSHRKGYVERFGLERLARVILTAPQHPTSDSPATVPASSPSSITYTATHTTLSGYPFQLEKMQVADKPPIEFTYEQAWGSGTVFQPAEVWNADLDPTPMPARLGRTTTSPDGSTSKTVEAFVDVTGDGLPDLVDSASECGGYWRIWRNRRGSFGLERWQAPGNVVGPQPVDPCSMRVTEQEGNTNRTVQEFIDLTGDSRPDLAYWQGATTWMCENTGSGFAACRPWGTLPAGATAGVFRRDDSTLSNFNVSNVDLVDYNADGLVDRVASLIDAGVPRVQVVWNRGPLGWGGMETFALPACSVPFVMACLRASERIAGAGMNRRLLVDIRDINGDGLPDYLGTSLVEGRIFVAWGTGADFVGGHDLMNAPAALGFGYESGSGEYAAQLDLVDVNGDSLPDIVEKEKSGNWLKVRYNRVSGWDLFPVQYELSGPAVSYWSRELSLSDSDSDSQYLRSIFMDADGDSLPEFVAASTATGSLALTTLGYRAPSLMVEAASLSRNVSSRFLYSPVVGGLPFPVHAPLTLTRTRSPAYAGESARQTVQRTEFTFSDPVYDHSEREFRGFRSVIETDLEFGRVTTTSYLTGKFSAGLVESQIVANVAASSVPSSAINSYTEVSLPGGARFVRLDSSQILEGLLLAWRVTTVRHEDYFYGYARRTVRVGASADPSDDIVTRKEYVVRDDSDHRLVLPSRETVVGPSGEVVSDALNYYDDRLTHGVVPTRGNLLRGRVQDGPFYSVVHDAYYDDEDGSGVGSLVRYRDPMGADVDYFYDAAYAQFPVREVTAVGVTHRSFHALFGVLADVCGPQTSAGTWRCSRSEVDSVGRPSATYVPILRGGLFEKSRLAVYSYDETSYPLREQVTLRPGARDEARTIHYFDGFGNLVQKRIEEERDLFRVQDIGADAFGKVQWESRWRREAGASFASEGDPGVEATRYSYDYVRGQEERTTFPRDFGDTRPPSFRTRIELGTHVRTTDASGRVEQVGYDPFGRIAFRRLLGSLTQPTTYYGYDRANRLTRVLDPNGLETRYEYDGLGRMSAVVLPGLERYEYEYNDRGQVVSVTDPRGAIVETDYDSAGRPVRVSAVGGGMPPIEEVTEYYDGATAPAQLGWVSRRVGADAEYVYDYDAGGRVQSWRVKSSGIDMQATTAFSSDGRLVLLTYPDGWALRHNYYLDGSLRSIVDESTGQSLRSVLLDDNGRPSVVTSDDGFEESFVYDVRDRVVRVTSGNSRLGTEPVVDDVLAWTDANELARLERHGLAPGGQARVLPDVHQISRDDFGRLAGVVRNGYVESEYHYDVGGRLTRMLEGQRESTYHYSGELLSLRLGTSFASYGYDGAGSVLTEQGGDTVTGLRERSFEWDAMGRLAGVKEERSFDQRRTAYSFLGTELVRVNDYETGRQWLYLGGLARVDVVTGEVVNSVYHDKACVAERRSGVIEFLHRTLGGSTAAVTDSGGGLLWQQEFFPFGASHVSSGSRPPERGFQSMRADELLVAGTRAYDPIAGRWLARDPLQLAPTFAGQAELDTYGFAFNRPFEFRDPSGLQAVPGEEYATPGEPPPPGYYIDHRGKYVEIDEEEPADLALQSARSEYDRVSGRIAVGAAGADAAMLFFEFLPGVSAYKAAAEGNEGAAAGWLALDFASMGSASVLKGAGKGLLRLATPVVKGLVRGSKFSRLHYAKHFGFASYRQLRNAVGVAGDAEVHHLLNGRFAPVLGQSYDDMLSIVLTKDEHREFTRAWAKEIPYGVVPSVAEIRRAARKIYKDYPEILRELRY